MAKKSCLSSTHVGVCAYSDDDEASLGNWWKGRDQKWREAQDIIMQVEIPP